MNKELKNYILYNVIQFGGDMKRMEVAANALEMFLSVADAGLYGDEYSKEQVEKSRQRAASIRSAMVGGSSKYSELN